MYCEIMNRILNRYLVNGLMIILVCLEINKQDIDMFVGMLFINSKLNNITCIKIIILKYINE